MCRERGRERARAEEAGAANLTATQTGLALFLDRRPAVMSRRASSRQHQLPQSRLLFPSRLPRYTGPHVSPNLRMTCPPYRPCPPRRHVRVA